MLRTRVITALVMLAVLLVVLFLNSFLLFVLVISLFFAAAAWENLRLFDSRYPVIGAVIWAAAFYFIVFKVNFTFAHMFFGLCVAIWVLRLIPSLKIGLPPLTGFRNHLLNGIYGVAILACFLAMTALFKHSPLYLFSVLAIVWIADIGAYFSGKAFGRRKLAPSISPGKSWEGAFGGWIAVLVLAAATTMLPSLSDTFAVKLQAQWGWLGFLGCLSLLVGASIAGDLFESQLKRRIGFKDSSSLLPGHGGVLDRIDALIPVLPLAVFFNFWM